MQAKTVHIVNPSLIINQPAIGFHITSSYEQLLEAFSNYSIIIHRLSTSLAEAELILAPIQGGGYGICLEKLRASSIYRDYGHKLIVYCPDDNQFPSVRGLYPSITKKWVRRGWALPAHYISAHIRKFTFDREEIQQKDILCSFMGASRTHRIREAVCQLRHPEFVLVDSSSRADKEYWWEKANKEEYFARYRDLARRSQFMICPRGISSSSIRLYEAMEAGAVPIILSDSLQLPLGPNWDEFSIRVRERDVFDLPTIVEQQRDRAPVMGRLARQAWEGYFSPQATANSIVHWASLLLQRSHQRSWELKLAELSHPRRLLSKFKRS